MVGTTRLFDTTAHVLLQRLLSFSNVLITYDPLTSSMVTLPVHVEPRPRVKCPLSKFVSTASVPNNSKHTGSARSPSTLCTQPH